MSSGKKNITCLAVGYRTLFIQVNKYILILSSFKKLSICNIHPVYSQSLIDQLKVSDMVGYQERCISKYYIKNLIINFLLISFLIRMLLIVSLITVTYDLIVDLLKIVVQMYNIINLSAN